MNDKGCSSGLNGCTRILTTSWATKPSSTPLIQCPQVRLGQGYKLLLQWRTDVLADEGTEYGFMYDFDHFRYYQVPRLKLSNVYPSTMPRPFMRVRRPPDKRTSLTSSAVSGPAAKVRVVLW